MISLLHKTWRVSQPSPETVNALVQELGISSIVAGLLVNRKVTTADSARYFLDADLTKLHDPFLMTGMQKAVDRVIQSIEAKEKITVFCDYDVDGVSSAAVLIHFFRDLGVSIDYYLPERMAEGYGLNASAVRTIREKGSTLMITADCGITGNREVEIANDIGLDVIVTDHHQVGADGLPDCVAVLNPHQPDCQYPYRFLSGVGIIFKLATAIRSALYHQSGWEKSRLPNLQRHLDLFTLGASGKDRGQLQIFNRYDRCCYNNRKGTLYETAVAEAVREIGQGGGFGVFIDESHADHRFSTIALATVLAHMDGVNQ